MRVIGLFLALGLVLAPLAAEAQQAGKVPRVALLSTAGDPAVLGAFAAEMRALGYVEGQNLVTEIRTAGRPERFPELVSELIRFNVDVIVAWSALAVRTAKQATTTIPIVMGSSGDAVAPGLGFAAVGLFIAVAALFKLIGRGRT
jgi:putative ABC transport system substrate-binding protein